jgi:hypothetical protein
MNLYESVAYYAEVVAKHGLWSREAGRARDVRQDDPEFRRFVGAIDDRANRRDLFRKQEENPLGEPYMIALDIDLSRTPEGHSLTQTVVRYPDPRTQE